MPAKKKAAKKKTKKKAAPKKPEFFKDRIGVLEHLKAEGFNVEKTKVYDDSRRGNLILQKDNSVLKSDVEKYKAYLGIPKDPDRVLDMQAEKLAEEVKGLKIKNESAQFKLDVDQGKYILKDELIMEIAGRAGVFDSGIDYILSAYMREALKLCDGDLSKTQEVTDFFIRKKDERMNEFARVDKFQVIITKEK